DPDALVDEDVRQLAQLAQELDSEERTTEGELRQERADDEGMDVDFDDESWVDEVETMDDEEQAAYERDIRPLKMVLVKIRKISFKIIHSTTKLLPAWRDIVKELNMRERLLPRDVKTRWNSSFDMAEVAVEYRPAIERL
ncbi:hypothetical protein L226DRAFT_431217, partial [Lentinus tigrinus ALCF2SS1-7]